jgi:hypothetical protein
LPPPVNQIGARASDRFVAPGFVNRLWGLPLYHVAQLIIAWSIMVVSG